MMRFEDVLSVIDERIKNINYDYPAPQLFDPIKYILSLGGKRIRPALTLMAADIFSGKLSDVLDPAIGLELFHNFTLLHDDLMDRSDLRRGKITVHKKWSENTAILSGDALQILAYEYMLRTPSHALKPVLDLFTSTATEICAGQQYDLEFENRTDVSKKEYLEMIRLKTAVLLGCALKTGALIAGASEKDASGLYDYGINIGLAFQLKDDLLDVYADTVKFGKKTGGDILCNKKTYLLISALELAQGKDREVLLAQLANDAQTDEEKKEKIDAVTAVYNNLNLKSVLEEKINDYYKKGGIALSGLSVESARLETLRSLADQLMYREV
ncbi:MAG: polyprenyl synthetase family protein [Bacteroidales bacterium]|nr:polyprenyl synthetase family protein [Bacteroidales bacterium]